MSLTGTPLMVLLIILGVGLPVVLAVWSVRRRRSSLLARWGAGVVSFVGIVLCQLLLVGAVFVVVNRDYGFYTSWGDLLGTSNPGAQLNQGDAISVPPAPAGGAPAGVPADLASGKVVTITVHGRVSRTTMPVQVWLPPQYFDKAHARSAFPVLMFLPGYPEAPAGAEKAFHIVAQGLAAIDQGRAQPFVMVFPPITIRPGLDTECVNFPHGPLAESWLTHDVRNAVARHFRVDKAGRRWAIAGWSTGGYCAANLYLRNPSLFHAAVSVGGYFTPAFDATSDPQLAATERALVTVNSPLHRFHTDPPSSARMLLIASKQDPEAWHGASYADGREMAALTANTPGVEQINLPSGGHHGATYRPTIPVAMTWLGRQGI